MKTILNDPIGWAERAVGTAKKYRFMQCITILSGVLVFVLLFIMKKFNRPLDYFPLHLMLFILIVVFPLMYLKALRELLEQLKTKEKKPKDT